MTEQTAPFGSLAVAEPQTALLPGDGVDDSEPDNRRKLAAVAAAVGVVVLLIAAFFLLKGGGDDVATGPVAPHAVLPTEGQPAQDGGKAVADKPVKLPKSYSDPVGRDPFEARYTAPVVEKTDGGTGTSSSTGTATGTDAPTDNVTVTETPGTAVVPVPVWVELVKVNGTKSATFVVAFNDGNSLKTERFAKVRVPTSTASTVFGGVFALLDVHGNLATIQYGDGTPIDLAPGPGNRLVVS